MWPGFKVTLLRRYYRFANWKAWRAPNVEKDPGRLHIHTGSVLLKAQLYRGARASQRPIIVYFHGGGWVLGDLQTHHAYCRALSDASGATLLAIDYRRAPENPFPGAQDDCLGAATAIAEGGIDLGPSNGTIMLAGDSAGGHLALCTALEANGELATKLAGLILTYPVVDHYSQEYPSYTECAKGQVLTRDFMEWFWNLYLAGLDPASSQSLRAYPIRSDNLAALPPSLICTCGRDPLRDEGIAMKDRMLTAGVDTMYEHYPDSEHGFACSQGTGRDYDLWLERCASWVRNQAEGGEPHGE
ncbi:MAG: alpha/beta hydrolase [Pseudomonadota bacterium]